MEKNMIKFYEESKTGNLQILLNGLETAYDNTEYIIDEIEKNGGNIFMLERKIIDYQIDISLIRMELNKRLWNELT